jgi:dynein heavy chain
MKEEGILFLFTDGQITNERFLVYINDLLSSGEVTYLYAPEDKDNIINQIRAKVKSAGIQDTNENCWNYYIDRVKANLHMALCFSPVGDEGLRRRARQFPALVNSTVIDWFQPWPKQALRNVAASFLKEIDFIPEAIRENVIDFMPYSFERVNKASEEMLPKERRYVYTTRKSFFELIKLFKTMLNRKKDELESSKGRYQLGLEKLQETAASVSQLEKEL